MLTVIVPMKQVNPATLKVELVAAGVPSWSDPLDEPAYAGSSMMVVIVPNGADPEVVAEVVANHQDNRTAEQVERARAKALIVDPTPKGRRDKARDKLTMQAIRSLMAWCNNLRSQLIAAGLPVTVPKLRPRTWEELEEAVRALIDE